MMPTVIPGAKPAPPSHTDGRLSCLSEVVRLL